MNGQIRFTTSLILCALVLASGCKPTQPFFFKEDGEFFGTGDLSHYTDIATDIEYPDVATASLDEVHAAQAPLTIANSENFDVWDLTLEEVTRITLTNSNVIRQLGGRITDGGSNIAGAPPETLQNNAAGVTTTYDPALVESGDGTGTGNALSGTGVESALSQFDAVLDASVTWQNNDRPQNFGGAAVVGIPDFFANNFIQDTANGTLGITKTTADGSIFEVRSNTIYDQNNNGSRAIPSDWFTNAEVAITRPLLAGAGTLVNRIAGPQTFQQAAGGAPNQIDGVIIARIRHDITLTDFESGVRDLMRDVEDAYWELYFAYRDLEARKAGRDSALETWQRVKALQEVGGTGGEANLEAQARSQYFLFRSQVETALTNLFRLENNVRYMMGLAATDGRLIRPIDEPTTAQVHFDWAAIHSETLVRRTEIRRQKWQVKRRELELVAKRNNLLPRLDIAGRYRWLGAGDQLLDSSRNGIAPFAPGSTAFESLTTGNFQEWQIGLQFSQAIGFRNALVGIRHHQLLLARERAVLQDLELEFSHQITRAIQDLDLNFGLTQTNFNRRVATDDQVDAVAAVYEVGRVPLDTLLDAQRLRAEAASAYYRSLVDYNRAIMRVHYRKGSLLEYNGVYLAEGPWPGKAQFDALRRARQRDASTFINYGFTRPSVISRGPHAQHTGNHSANPIQPTPAYDGPIIQEPAPAETEGSGSKAEGSDSKDNNNNLDNQQQEALPAPEGVQVTSASAPVSSTPLPATTPALHITELQNPASNNLIPVHSNPYRQELKNWLDSTTRGLPAGPTAVNPLRATQNTQFTTSWTAEQSSATHESQSHRTPAETAPNAPVWPRAER